MVEGIAEWESDHGTFCSFGSCDTNGASAAEVGAAERHVAVVSKAVDRVDAGIALGTARKRAFRVCNCHEHLAHLLLGVLELLEFALLFFVLRKPGFGDDMV